MTGNITLATASPLKACFGKYLKKGNNNLDPIQIVDIVAYAVPNEQQKAYLMIAGAGPRGRGCKGALFNYCWPNIFPTRFSTTTKFLSERFWPRHCSS